MNSIYKLKWLILAWAYTFLNSLFKYFVGNLDYRDVFISLTTSVVIFKIVDHYFEKKKM